MSTRAIIRLRSLSRSSTALVYAVLLSVLIVSVVAAAISGRDFLSAGNLTALLAGTTILGFATIGQTLVILGGSLDLSVPFTISLSSVLAAGTMAGRPSALAAGVATALASTVCLGLVNGVLVGVLKMNGFIATLATGLTVSGYLYTNYRGSTGEASPQLASLGAASVGFVPIFTLLLLACVILAAALLKRTRIGLHLYAVGGDPEVARLSGVRTALPLIAAHAASGLCAGIAGLVVISRLGVGSPDVGSQGGYDLVSIAAVVLGGALISGGRGSVWGSLGGILIFACADSVMGVLQLNPYLQEVVRGLVIVVAVALYARRNAATRVARFASIPSSSGAAEASANRPEEGKRS